MTDFERAIIVLTLVATVLGWAFNYLQQRAIIQEQHKGQAQLEVLKQQLEQGRSAREHLVLAKLKTLDLIADWFKRGDTLTYPYARAAYQSVTDRNDQTTAVARKYYDEVLAWINEGNAHVSWVAEYETAPYDGPWDGSNGNLPTSLKALMPEMLECMNQINDLAERPIEEQNPIDYTNIASIGGDIHRKAFTATERLRRHYLSTTKAD